MRNFREAWETSRRRGKLTRAFGELPVSAEKGWGMLMADMARQIANAHETEYGRDPSA